MADGKSNVDICIVIIQPNLIMTLCDPSTSIDNIVPICDRICENPTLPGFIDFVLEAIIVGYSKSRNGKWEMGNEEMGK